MELKERSEQRLTEEKSGSIWITLVFSCVLPLVLGLNAFVSAAFLSSLTTSAPVQPQFVSEFGNAVSFGIRAECPRDFPCFYPIHSIPISTGGFGNETEIGPVLLLWELKAEEWHMSSRHVLNG